MRTLFLLAASATTIALAGCGSNHEAPVANGNVSARPDDTPEPIPGGERFENPTYTRWAKFPPGASVTQRSTTENADSPQKTVTTITYVLKEKTDDHVVIESKATTVHYTGRLEENPPSTTKTRRFFTLPPGMKKENDKQKLEVGEETLTVAGREYRTKWYKGKDFTEAGELFVQTWTSDEVPGGLLKSVSKVPAKRATITVEVIAVKVP